VDSSQVATRASLRGEGALVVVGLEALDLLEDCLHMFGSIVIDRRGYM
jgi:hypothetical protein